LSLSNTGTIVEQFAIQFLGEGALWIRSDPERVSMFPGAQQTVTLHFSPPRDHTVAAGSVPFAVKVTPQNEPDESVTEEGVITVGSFNDVGAELLPRQVNGRVHGRQRLAVDSRGNVPVDVNVSGSDGADALQFRFRPAELTTVPGGAHFIRVRIRPRKRFWRGPAQLKTYQIQVDAAGERPLVLDGQFTQRAVIPKWVMALIGALVVLALLWQFVLKPAVHDTAVNANKSALAAQQAQTNALKTQVSAAAQSASAANQNATAALAGVGKKPVATTTTSTSTTSTTVAKKTSSPTTVPVSTGSTPTTTAPPVTSPTDGRLETVSAPGSTATTATIQIPAGTTLTITNLVLQNISGSGGTARIERLVPNQPAESLLVENLNNLTDQEYNFNTPMVFSHDEQLALQVNCSGDQTACDVGVYYTGPITQPASSTTTTIP
jgi:type II secretory pathway component PulM